jgi:rhodanese-related sulfurtransferase
VSPHQHSAGFLALVAEAKTRVKEITISEYGERLMRREHHVLIDTREDHEWARGRLPGAMHLSRGIIERDIESYFADRTTPIVCYCGGGYRSALVCDSLQKMGYTNAVSLAGGIRAWQAAGLPVEKDGD